jgi:hypothetical protein
MRTLDINDSPNGIVILNGFGDKDWEFATYLNGKLIGQSRQDLEEDHPSLKLNRLLAVEAGLSWEERLTHIWWRTTFYCTAPDTLSEYVEKTLEAFRNASEKDLQPVLERAYIPREPADAIRQVGWAYSLGGGAEGQFDSWYKNWLVAQQSFEERFHVELERRRELEEAWKAAGSNALSDEHKAQFRILEKCMQEYLLDAYRADKPLDSFAKRARNAS